MNQKSIAPPEEKYGNGNNKKKIGSAIAADATALAP
jgi:hypothetical protein